MTKETTIDPQFLWTVRKTLGAVDALNLLTLISVGPGRYKTKDLATYCEAQRSNFQVHLNGSTKRGGSNTARSAKTGSPFGSSKAT